MWNGPSFFSVHSNSYLIVAVKLSGKIMLNYSFNKGAKKRFIVYVARKGLLEVDRMTFIKIYALCM